MIKLLKKKKKKTSTVRFNPQYIETVLLEQTNIGLDVIPALFMC